MNGKIKDKVAEGPLALVESGAEFDRTGRYRYRLWRLWDSDRPSLAMLMLNPSTADATVNDSTIAQSMRVASNCGFGSLVVVNLFAYRATRPYLLKMARDPVGKENDRHIVEAARATDALLVAWGNHGNFQNRSLEVQELLLASQAKIFCLGVTKKGQPRHPLYLKANTQLTPFDAAFKD
jgi:hypothetical protein